MKVTLAERLRAFSGDDWRAWIEACLRGENTLQRRRTPPDDPLLAVRQVLELGLGHSARLDHLAAVLALLGRRSRPTDWIDRGSTRALLLHLALTATAFEREQPEARGVEATLVALLSDEALRRPALRALAALDRPVDDGFWLASHGGGFDPLLAAEVLARRRSDQMGRALASAARFCDARPAGAGYLRDLLAGLLEGGVPEASLQAWLERAAGVARLEETGQRRALLEAALASLREAEDLRAGHPPTLRALGDTLSALGEHEAALEHHRRDAAIEDTKV